jgi:hypothetical protein
MDGINTAAPRKNIGHLRQAILPGIKDINLCSWIDALNQPLYVRKVAKYKNDFMSGGYRTIGH